MAAFRSVVMTVYDILHQLPRHDWRTARDELPESGIYAFFERGETTDMGGRSWDRFVYVGAHTRDGNFRQRMRQHFGPMTKLGGDRSASVFRKYLGGALLRRANPRDPRLQDWLTEVGKYPEIEAEVSRELRENFTFVCFPVEDQTERVALERSLIALLAEHPLGPPSAEWLGQYAVNERSWDTGLWNIRVSDAEPLTIEQVTRIRVLAGLC